MRRPTKVQQIIKYLRKSKVAVSFVNVLFGFGVGG